MPSKNRQQAIGKRNRERALTIDGWTEEPTVNELRSWLAVLETKYKPCTRWIQHSAAWPSVADFGSARVPPGSIRYVVTELVAASPETSWPPGPNVKAK